MIGRSALVIYISLFVDESLVVQHVTLQAVDYLYLLAFVPELFRSLCRVRESLYYSVVGNGHRRLSPGRGLVDYVRRFVEAVHGAHLGMGVKLNPLAVRPGVGSFHVGPFAFFQILYHYYIQIFKGVPLYLTSHLDGISGSQKLFDLLLFIFGDESLRAYGRRIVGKKQRNEEIAALYEAEIHLENSPLHHDCSLGRFDVPERRIGIFIYISSHYAVSLGGKFFFAPPAFPFASLLERIIFCCRRGGGRCGCGRSRRLFLQDSGIFFNGSFYLFLFALFKGLDLI